MIRLNFLAGPNAGKSTQAALIYSELKKRDYNVELVREVIKKSIYRGMRPTIWSQIPIYGAQFDEELICAESNDVDIITTDCPTLLTIFYTKHNHNPAWKHLLEIENLFEKLHPSINIFLKRGLGFNQKGRIHDLKQSTEIDRDIKLFLLYCNKKYKEFDYDKPDQIIDYVLLKLKELTNK
jgi:thymidylate kinase